jgi:C1A family cysteine protease
MRSNHFPRRLVATIFGLALVLAPVAAARPQVVRRPRRAQPHTQKRTYMVGDSPALARPLSALGDIKIPQDLPQTLAQVKEESERRLAAQRATQADFIAKYPGTQFRREWDFMELLKAEFQKLHPGMAVPQTEAAFAPYLPQFDWHRYDILPPVIDQGDCGSCWAFASTAAFESNINLQNLKMAFTRLEYDPNGRPGFIAFAAQHTIDFSEQALLNCVSAAKGSCSGGWPGSAFAFMLTTGMVRAENRPRGTSARTGNGWSGDYTGRVMPCDMKGEAVKAAAWGYVTYPPEAPTVAQLKAALLEHGPLVVLVHLDPQRKFQSYRRGVFNEHDAGRPNHAILLVGWDDARGAWHIQNSWGEEWGEQGFMWIAYDSNSIGHYATWVEAPIGYDTAPL